MAVTLTWAGSTPGQTQYGLDTLTDHYKIQNDDGSQITAPEVMTAAGVPSMTDAHPDYPFMFVTARYCAETGESASALDVTYTGCIRSSGESPALPSQQLNYENQVQSASSSKGTNAFIVLTSPLTAQFYAPSNVLTFITYGAPGTQGTVTDPITTLEVITVSCGDTTFAFASAGILELVSQFFTQQIVGSFQSTEIVAGKYWLNIDRKTVTLFPFIFNLAPGFYPVVYSGGSGYEIGDSITISGTGSCTMDVTAVYTPSGTLAGESITSNSLSAATGTPISATGGSGSGASFTVIEVT